MRNILISVALGLSLCVVAAFAQDRDSVRQTQQALKDKGYDPGPVDGVNGPKTQAALRQYQQKENLDEDGRIGPKTMDSLGVKHDNAGSDFDAAGHNMKHSYAQGGKDIGHGTKEAGSDLKHGDVIQSGKDFGKGVGHGTEKMAVGTGHAAKNAAKGSKNAVTGDTGSHQ